MARPGLVSIAATWTRLPSLGTGGGLGLPGRLRNPAFQPIPADDAAIMGKVVSVLRPPGPGPARRALMPPGGTMFARPRY